MQIGDDGLVTTIKELCRRCYACVRECPAEAIRIVDGQASVIDARCIGCANCFRVCSQNAKQAYSEVEKAFRLFETGSRVAAVVAPSFPAEFTEYGEETLASMLRELGFDGVHEVAFGADLVAHEYRRMLESDPQRYIATPCPSIVAWVRKYNPDLVPSLAPVVSPMVAMARVLHELEGPDTKVAFIGPCIAKKGEAAGPEVAGEVDAVLTFTELREMLALQQITPDMVEPQPFDPPRGALGSLFPLARGLLQAAHLPEDLLTGEIIAADGNPAFVEAIDDFGMGESEVRLLDILTCEGCIGGIGFSAKEPLHRRRALVSRRSKRQVDTFDETQWKRDMERYGRLDLSRDYTAGDQRFKVEPTEDEIREIFVRMNKFTPEDELNCGACGYDTCRAHAVACYQGIAEIEMCLPYLIEKLSTTVDDLEDSNRSLETTKEALIKTEKLASMGQLAAGIAHEVNNPLGIIMLQANILLEECEKGSEMGEDLELIVDQANRCKRIISGLLNFARQSRVVRQPKSVSDLVDQTLRTVPMEPNVKVTVDDRLADPVAEVDSDQIVQVLVNLITNAQQAMPDGGELRIVLTDDEDEVTVAVSDTGVGIPPENVEKLWDPFFTTKQVGKGTGLGLAVTHGIVKMHRGQCSVESNADPAGGPTGTTFRITLPRHEL